MQPGAVSFDLDGTLVLVGDDRTAILERACHDVGAPIFDREDYLAAHRRHHIGETRTPIFESLLQEAGADDIDPAELASAYRDRIGKQLVPIPQAETLLGTLGERVEIALVTNGPSRAQRDKLERLGWEEYFDAIVISGEVGVAKPDPEIFSIARSRLDNQSETMVHVGDTPQDDLLGAKRAGIAAIGVGSSARASPIGMGTFEPDELAERLLEEFSIKSLG